MVADINYTEDLALPYMEVEGIPAYQKMADFYRKLLSEEVAHILTEDEKDYCRSMLAQLAPERTDAE